MAEPGTDPAAVWLQARSVGESGARRFARALRERWYIVAVTVVAAVVVALLYVSIATPVYQAQANLLISPETDPNLEILPLFRTSSDPTRDTQTASLLVDTPAAAAQAVHLLRTSESPQALLRSIQVQPVAGSDVIAVTASASTPGRATRVANAFAQGAINVLSARFQAQLASAIPRLQAQVNQSSTGATATATAQSLASQLSALRALQGAPDPTIQLESPATAPTSPVSPRRKLSLLAGLLLGLVLGIAIAIAADALDPRLRRESQLQEVLDLPVLAHVPWLASGPWVRSRADPQPLKSLLTSHEFLAAALESFDRRSPPQKRTIVFTAPHRNAGCTTIAVHHAWVAAAAGERVILVDGDPRDPAVGAATGAEPSPQLEHVLGGDRAIDDALVSVEAGGVGIRVLAIQEGLDGGLRTPRVPMGREMIADLLPVADVLVVDTPPLSESAPAFMLARAVDRVVVVARVGVTRLAELKELSEMFAGHGIPGAGVVLVGGVRHLPGRRGPHLSAWRARLTRASGANGSAGRRNGRRSADGSDIGARHALTSGRAGPRGRDAPPSS